MSDIHRLYKRIKFLNRQKKVNVAVFFQYFSGRCRILTAHSIRLSLIRNSRVAGFQGRVACRSDPLEGLTTAVCYINSKGGTKSPSCNDITCEIWSWCINNNTWLTATHIPGVQNTDADRESRIFNERTEWQLNPDVFIQIRDRDCEQTASCVCFMEARTRGYPYSFDAFTIIDWSKYKFYCFPPFSLISRCLRKVEMDMKEGILIAPIWPTQVWWPQMLRLLIRHPVALPRQKKLLKLPNTTKIHPLHAKLVLMACYISGDPMKRGISESACNLLMASWRPGTQKQYQVYIQKWSNF